MGRKNLITAGLCASMIGGPTSSTIAVSIGKTKISTTPMDDSFMELQTITVPNEDSSETNLDDQYLEEEISNEEEIGRNLDMTSDEVIDAMRIEDSALIDLEALDVLSGK